jgi:hypothetical protein
MKRKQRTEPFNFELILDGRTIEVTARPYMAANEQPRFRVSYDDGPVHIFGYDEQENSVQVMDSASGVIHPKVESAISDVLMQHVASIKQAA